MFQSSIWRCRLTLAALCAAALIHAVPAGAQDLKKISVNSFKSSTAWPIWAAQKNGFFAQEGLAIDLTFTRGSREQMTSLIRGGIDVAVTALDNVIAYVEGEGSPDAPKNADLIAFMGGNNGNLRLIALPDIKSVKDLKGKDIAVDAISTGFSFVLREILAKSGLKPDDYKFVAVGGTGQRWQALQKKLQAAALLTPPLTLIAEARGFNNLADASDVLGSYQGLVGSARREWAQKNSDLVIRYIRAYRRGQDWLYAPGNKDAAISILRAEIPETSQKLAEATYVLLIGKGTGFDRDAKLNLTGAKHVLDLRRRYGPQGKTIADVRHFIDDSYFEKALKR